MTSYQRAQDDATSKFRQFLAFCCRRMTLEAESDRRP